MDNDEIFENIYGNNKSIIRSCFIYINYIKVEIQPIDKLDIPLQFSPLINISQY